MILVFFIKICPGLSGFEVNIVKNFIIQKYYPNVLTYRSFGIMLIGIYTKKGLKYGRF